MILKRFMRLYLQLAATCVSENVENLCSACILRVFVSWNNSDLLNRYFTAGRSVFSKNVFIVSFMFQLFDEKNSFFYCLYFLKCLKRWKIKTGAIMSRVEKSLSTTHFPQSPAFINTKQS